MPTQTILLLMFTLMMGKHKSSIYEILQLNKSILTRPSKQCKSLICKGTEEHGGGQIIQMVICNNPCLSVPLILVIWRTVLFASDHLQRYGGDWIIRMIICNNSCSFVPLLLVIRRTVLFANDHLQRKGRARRRPNHPDDHFQGSLIPKALIYDGTESI